MIGNNAFWTLTGSYFGDPYWANTVLLLHGDGTNTTQNNTFIDSSGTPKTITRAGNTTQGSFSPFVGQGGSIYFDGTGDYLSVPSNAALQMGSSDFTIEGWIYINSQSSFAFYDQRTATSQFVPTLYVSGGVIRYYVNGTNVIIGDTLITNTWYHIALTRSGTSTNLFVNGIKSGSTYTDSNNYLSNRVVIGIFGDGTAGNLNGYISNLRITKGIALYTANFTPPTAPLTSDANTSLLLKGENGAIIDSTRKNDLETVGNAQISTTIPGKFGGSSMYFDGSGDYLSVPNNSNFVFGTDDFTIEGWIKTSDTTPKGVIGTRNSSNPYTNMWQIFFNGSRLEFWGNRDTLTSSNTTIVNDNNWHHFASIRKNGSTTLYVDGVAGTTNTTSFNYQSTNNIVIIGNDTLSLGTRSLNGYIDDLRITKGVARYNANFTVPTQPFPNW